MTTKEKIEKKDFVILGTGISGLSTGFYLKQKDPHYSVLLLEKENHSGGWVQTLKEKEFFFDTGPKGFLAKGKGRRTLQMVYDLGIYQKLLQSNDSARVRFLYYQQKLHALPKNLLEISRSELLGTRELKTLIQGLFKKDSQTSKEESVSEFIQRQFSQDILNRFIDPWITGVYAGDTHQLSSLSIFPRLKNLDNSSILGKFLKSKLQKKPIQPVTENIPKEILKIPKLKLLSFQGGMETLVGSLYEKLKEKIYLNIRVQKIEFLPNETILSYTDGKTPKQCRAKTLIFATPSHATAKYLKELDSELSDLLLSIEYADLQVLHLGYKKRTQKKLPIPKGFGFLVPRSEGLHLLGVLFNEEIFPSIFDSDNETLTAMYGGACDPEVIDWSQKKLLQVAQKELFQTLGIRQEADCMLVRRCKKAIPQYNLGHSEKIQKIQNRLRQYPSIQITGNYLDGVGINDCIDHAYRLIYHQLSSEPIRESL